MSGEKEKTSEGLSPRNMYHEIKLFVEILLLRLKAKIIRRQGKLRLREINRKTQQLIRETQIIEEESRIIETGNQILNNLPKPVSFSELKKLLLQVLPEREADIYIHFVKEEKKKRQRFLSALKKLDIHEKINAIITTTHLTLIEKIEIIKTETPANNPDAVSALLFLLRQQSEISQTKGKTS